MEANGMYKRLCEELRPFIIEIIQEELASFVKTFKADLDQVDSGNYVPVKEACKLLGVSRQTLYNWEKGRYNIGSFIRQQGRYRLYDVVGIKAKLAGMHKLQDKFGPKFGNLKSDA